MLASDLTRVCVCTLIATVFFGTRAFPADNEEKELRTLVQSLVSKNAEPPPARLYTRYEFPEGFDRKENQRVIETRDALMTKGAAAFPYLIEALDDTRYSYTGNLDSLASHFQVREVCLRIIQAQVEVYGEFMRPLNVRIDYPLWLPVPEPNRNFWPKGAKGYMQKWWKPRSTMSLCELQREAVGWAVEYEQSRGFTDKEEKALVLGWYKPLQDRLQSSEKPIRVSWNGKFIDEDTLKPKDPDWDRWYERWGDRWLGDGTTKKEEK